MGRDADRDMGRGANRDRPSTRSADQDDERDPGGGCGTNLELGEEPCQGGDAAADAAEGTLCYGGARWPISGRALRLMLWLAAQQQRINTVASERGQLWITWKGNGPHSIDGEVKARLARE